MGSNEEKRENSKIFVAHAMKDIPVAQVLMAAAIAFGAWFFSVPTRDVAFVLLFSLYLVLANKFRFDCNAPARKTGKEINLPLLMEDDVMGWFPRYMGVFATAGVILPLVTLYVGENKAAAPHCFLLLSQIFMEAVTNSVEYHNLIRLLVPIGFNAYRIPSLLTWVEEVLIWKNGSSVEGCWNLGLAVVNLVLWAYNLFVFLLLRTLPAYLDPTTSPAPPVVWMGQVLPVVERQEKKE